MPDRAGAKTSWLDLLKFILKVIPIIPNFMFACRPSVVDARVHEAGDPSLRELWPLSMNLDL